MNKALHQKEKNIYVLRLQGTKHLMGKRYMYMCVNIKTQTTNRRAQQVGGMKDKAWVYGFKKTSP